MSIQDWWIACLVAMGVAALTMVALTPPLCWAEQRAMITIPALPSTQLTIPTLQATVTANTTPMPGLGVQAMLNVRSPAETDLREVPVTVTVLRTVMNPMSRSMPRPQQVAQVAARVPVGLDGNGTTVVDLPLVWATPTPAAVNPDGNSRRVVQTPVIDTFQLVLSSPLGGQTAPATLQRLSMPLQPSANPDSPEGRGPATIQPLSLPLRL